MKKLLFIMAMMLPLFTFVGCSDDDEVSNENELIGTWVESKESPIEVYHIQFKSDYTGLHWVTNNGDIDEWGKEPITWSTSGNNLTVTTDDEPITVKYSIKNNTLTMDFGDETLTCKREK